MVIMNHLPNSKLLEGSIPDDEYRDYYSKYIELTTGLNLFDQLEVNRENLKIIFKGLQEEKANYAYAEGKWTMKEVLGHITDTERIFNYRALALARGEKVSLPGYDHDQYAENANFQDLPVEFLLNDYELVRNSTISLFRSFDDEQLMRRGIVNDSEFTVRSLGYVIAGHELHHQQILREKYIGQ